MEEKEHLWHKRLFSLCICTHRYWAIFRPLQLSNIVTTTAMGAKFKGAMDDANPRYTCQTWLPCPGWLNVILCPCLCQLTSTSLRDALCTGAVGPSCYGTSEGMTRISPSSRGSPGSSYLSLCHHHLLQVLCYSLPAALRLLLKLDWATQLG